jgi:hypothetical membrane protein
MASKTDRVKQAWHLFAGLLVLMPAFSSFEGGDFKSAAGYFAVAMLALIAAGVHKHIERNFQSADIPFFLLEAITLSYSAWHYREEGRQFLSLLVGAVAVVFLFLAIKCVMTSDEPRKKRSRKHFQKRSVNTSAGQ